MVRTPYATDWPRGSSSSPAPPHWLCERAAIHIVPLLTTDWMTGAGLHKRPPSWPISVGGRRGQPPFWLLICVPAAMWEPPFYFQWDFFFLLILSKIAGNTFHKNCLKSRFLQKMQNWNLNRSLLIMYTHFASSTGKSKPKQFDRSKAIDRTAKHFPACDAGEGLVVTGLLTKSKLNSGAGVEVAHLFCLWDVPLS